MGGLEERRGLPIVCDRTIGGVETLCTGTNLLVPNSDIAIGAYIVVGSVSFFGAVDEDPPDDDTSYIEPIPGPAGGSYTLGLSDTTILGVTSLTVKVRARINAAKAEGVVFDVFDSVFNVIATGLKLLNGGLIGPSAYETLEFMFTTNLFTGLPFTQADLNGASIRIYKNAGTLPPGPGTADATRVTSIRLCIA